MKQYAFRVLATLAALLGLLACVQGALLALTQARQVEATRTWAAGMTTEITQGLSRKLANASQAAEALASRLNQAACSPCEIEPSLQAFRPQRVGFASLAQRGTEPWYAAALAQAGHWLPPLYEPALPGFVLRYSVVVRDARKQEVGLAYVDLSLDDLASEMRRHDIRNNNYVNLRSPDGTELFHSLKSTAQIIRSLPLKDADTAETGRNTLTHGAAWQHTGVVAPPGWVVTTTVDKGTDVEVTPSAASRWLVLTKERSVPWVLLLVLTAASIYTCYLLRRPRTSLRAVWVDSAVYSLLMALGVVGIWVLQAGKLDDAIAAARVLSNRAAVEQYQRAEVSEASVGRHSTPRFVPVGLFIQSIEFLTSHNVEVTGYIWHRYPEGEPSDYKTGTVFPEAISTEIQEVQTATSGGETLKSWYFKAVLRQNFTPTHYPFDRQSVWIRLWHEKIGESIKLVPDFKAYNSLNTRSLPGVEKDFVLSGWSLYQSYFEVQEKEYNTRLGAVSAADYSTVSELYFHVELSRNLLNPFLAHLFPLSVVMLMLYAIVVTMSIEHEGSDLLGFNAAAVVASCSALFFVALISHVQMRNELASNSVVYLEFFYLITYVTILMITTNAVLLSLKVNLQLIRFHDNLLPKLLYWPFVTLVLLACTGWIFW